MAEQIEVYFHDKIGPYKNGQVALFDENNKFLHAILKGKKAVVLNPPDWELPGVTVEHAPAPVVPVLVKGTKEELETIQKVAPGLASGLVVKEEVKKEEKSLTRKPKVEEPVGEESVGKSESNSEPESEGTEEHSSEVSASDQGHGEASE